MVEKRHDEQNVESSTPDTELSDLLQQALHRPGVREMMAVLETWQTFDRRSHPYYQFIRPRVLVSTGSASGPVTQAT
jgi:hypothetical protein